MALTARQVAAAKPGRHMDGRGLMLLVKRGGSRSWVLRFQINGRRRDMGLGAWPAVTLAMARMRALEARRLLSEKHDPLAERKRVTKLMFRDAALQTIEAQRYAWRNAKHAAQWVSTLNSYAFPALGNLDVGLIGTADILAVLRPHWIGKPETASRVRQRIEAVLDYATSIGARSGENPARWRGHLSHLLPSPNKVRIVVHHAAQDWRQLPNFMKDLATRDGIGARALAFAILTVARSGEARGATWAEFDIEDRVWTVPAVRMKGGKEHRVPLTIAAIAQIGEPGPPQGLVFSGWRQPDRPISDMTLSAVLRRMGRAEITVHGFRSSFRDWAGETTAFPREVIEAALAHRLRDKAEAAYARGDLFAKRRALMDAWSAYAVRV